MPNNIALNTFEAIHSLMHLYRAEMHKSLKKDENTLTHMEHKTLGFFSANQGATLSDLVQHSYKDKAQLTRLLKGLKEKGLIEETKDPVDKRRTLLTVTPDGIAIHQAFKIESALICEQAIVGLAPEDIDSLLRITEQIKSNLEKIAEE